MSDLSEKILIITAPSGAGKSTITKRLMETFPALSFSISAATRAPRGDEKNGVEYYFITPDEFKQKIKENAFAEWEMVYEGKYYGTYKSEIERIWKNEQTPILDIDVKGALHIHQLYPGQTLSIFIEPPSIDELKKRLRERGTENEDGINTRINKAEYELSFKGHFDKVILNDNLEKACSEAIDTVSKFLTGNLKP
jgi:guanylate kinase